MPRVDSTCRLLYNLKFSWVQRTPIVIRVFVVETLCCMLGLSWVTSVSVWLQAAFPGVVECALKPLRVSFVLRCVCSRTQDDCIWV